MTLFALLGLPAFLMIAYGLLGTPRPGRSRASVPLVRTIPLVEYLKGLVFGVVGAVAAAVLERFLPVSYRPFPLFLYLLVVDFLVAAALAAAAVAVFYGKRSTRQTVFFVGGFYSVVAVASVLISYGAYEPYSLFLRPTLYMATVLFLPLLYRGYQEWYGLRKGLFVIALGATPLAAAGIALLHRTFHEWWAFGAAAAFLGGAAALLYWSGER
ncbi:MAG: hypothetical protein JW820_17965 [Spirochaetales bacterium]|nr:hypothetical protein [Spirochaetales bacterium]